MSEELIYKILFAGTMGLYLLKYRKYSYIIKFWVMWPRGPARPALAIEISKSKQNYENIILMTVSILG